MLRQHIKEAKEEATEAKETITVISDEIAATDDVEEQRLLHVMLRDQAAILSTLQQETRDLRASLKALVKVNTPKAERPKKTDGELVPPPTQTTKPPPPPPQPQTVVAPVVAPDTTPAKTTQPAAPVKPKTVTRKRGYGRKRPFSESLETSNFNADESRAAPLPAMDTN